jgi:hypothetical protein
MTPTEYRQFCETTYCAPASVDREEYLRLLLIEEVGEVASLFAKAMRDGHEVDRGRLMKELGDVMWCAVAYASATHMDEWPATAEDGGATSFADALVLIADTTPYLFPRVCDLCIMCGFAPEDVALANVEKLQSRQARGVLHGSGDEDGQLESMDARIMALEALVAAMADEIARLQPNLLDGVMAKAKFYKTEFCDE